MRNTRIHRRIDDITTAFISEYIADMTDEELYVYVKEVFLMDPADDWVGHDSEIAINCAMALLGRSLDRNRGEQDRIQMAYQYRDLSLVLEQCGIIDREELKEIVSE